jgi:hypothetical protein
MEAGDIDIDNVIHFAALKVSGGIGSKMVA